MTNRKLLAIMAFLFLGILIGEAKSKYDIKWNERRITEISKEILNQVSVQEAEYRKILEDYQKNKNGNNGGMYDAGPMMYDGPNSEKKEDDTPKYKLDIDKIKAVVTKKFGGNEMDSFSDGVRPAKVDLRTKHDLQEEARKIVEAMPEFKKNFAELEAQEIKDAEELIPLYKEGETVEIRFAHGNEPRRTYKGTFRLNGPFKLWIGRNMLNKNDLPEVFRVRFYPDLNEKARQEEIAKHRLITKFNIDKEEAISKMVKEMQQKQFDQNLPRGWVYINDTWKMPSEMVEDTLMYRKDDLKRRQARQVREAERAAQMEAEMESEGGNGRGYRSPVGRARDLR